MGIVSGIVLSRVCAKPAEHAVHSSVGSIVIVLGCCLLKLIKCAVNSDRVLLVAVVCRLQCQLNDNRSCK